MKKMHKITNADTLRGLKKIDDKFFEENGEHCLTENVRNYIDDVLSSSDDDFIVNAVFNRGLKSKMPKQIKKGR